MIGLGTVINVIAIVIGSAIGVALGHRLGERTRDVVTDGLGLVVLLVAALSAAAITNEALSDVVGSATVIVVLAAIIIGGVIGSILRIEDRMEELGMWVRRRFAVGTTAKVSIPDVNITDAPEERVEQSNPGELAAAQRFVDGFVTASLVFCVGPLAIMGALNDGLGLGIEQLALKSGLDGFASIAFAATLGWGVAVSAVAVALYQGSWTLLGVLLGDVLAEAQIAALTATGGLLLVGIGLRLLRVNTMRVGDLLPSLFIAPLIVGLWSAFGQN